MEFVKTKDGTVVGFYKATTVYGTSIYTAVVQTDTFPWSVTVSRPNLDVAELVVQRYKETINGKESAEPR